MTTSPSPGNTSHLGLGAMQAAPLHLRPGPPNPAPQTTPHHPRPDSPNHDVTSLSPAGCVWFANSCAYDTFFMVMFSMYWDSANPWRQAFKTMGPVRTTQRTMQSVLALRAPVLRGRTGDRLHTLKEERRRSEERRVGKECW